MNAQDSMNKPKIAKETKNKITKANLKKYEKYINDTKIYPIRHKNIKNTEKEKLYLEQVIARATFQNF